MGAVRTRALEASHTVSRASRSISVLTRLLKMEATRWVRRPAEDFLLEFSMPHTDSAAFNGDMPAIWLLNAQIPLTSQYGTNAQCSWYVCSHAVESLVHPSTDQKPVSCYEKPWASAILPATQINLPPSPIPLSPKSITLNPLFTILKLDLRLRRVRHLRDPRLQ